MMPFTTSHTESGEGPRALPEALDRALDWLRSAEPGNSPVRWRITVSFKETNGENVDNEGARRSGKLPFDDPPKKRGRNSKKTTPLVHTGEDDDD
jgi:hypothetical protein